MTRDAGSTAPADLSLRSERGRVLLAVMLATGLVALDSTIIATAVPSVVADVGGFAQFPWLFSVYLLTQAVSVPLYGKFADVVGRKPVILFGIGVFLLGSVCCAAAWSMLSLIAFRAVQGLGAGAVQPVSMTIVGDMYSVRERAKIQGYLAGVWGAASVLGPTLGGVFSQYLSWRWIFLINLPLGAVAAWMLVSRFTEQTERSVRRGRQVDYPGAALLALGCSLLIVGLLEGGTAWAWGSATSLTVFAVAVAALVGFGYVEQHAGEPVLPLWVFRRRLLVGGNLVALIVGATLIGLSSYVPTFAQGVLGTGAVVAGFALAALTVGWPLTASLAGRLYTRIGFRDTSLVGTVLLVAGSVLCVLLPRDTNVLEIAGACFVVGAGLGLIASPTIVAVQSVVGWDRRGTVTGANMFCRSMGSAIGAAVFGAIANASLAHRFAHPPPGVSGLPSDADATSLVLGGTRGHSPATVDFIRQSLYAGTHDVFRGVLVLSVLCIAAIALMPRRTHALTFD